ncbi:hypothetical protein BS47DRAFT_1358581 [Hydnum rufescens UP504]|uniref:Uncharacterized protein n=1 Tax=Hydnum rufescens UP504 TaxID=1448309 RepID=A0A9P6E1R1_9AGAM|nr:hypothetical protein BS47DRAFT_1358581 [Hydnum rufescens UP504]
MGHREDLYEQSYGRPGVHGQVPTPPQWVWGTTRYWTRTHMNPWPQTHQTTCPERKPGTKPHMTAQTKTRNEAMKACMNENCEQHPLEGSPKWTPCPDWGEFQLHLHKKSSLWLLFLGTG